MAETLLSISEVLLYGEKVADMTYKDKAGDPKKRFVRVYGFGFEGGYYGLDAPIIMLVAGESKGIDKTPTPKDVKDSFRTNIDVWSIDKSDHAVRLDELTGTIEEILLDVEIGSGMGPISGGKVAGGKVAGGKVAGGKVAGGKVAGGKVAGGKVSGGKVSGD